ncbi:MAG: KpsF/GutQ family sugar-phosphate isomerase [Acidobacteria bacterium]|nr:KpsF/GutQ family sugar-phosphate isomerase [Acidobacteriota bacterium]
MAEDVKLKPRSLSGKGSLARQVLEIEAEAIQRLADRLDERFDRAVELVVNCRGRVVTTGMGKSGIICKKIAATLSSTGTPAFFLHPAEAIHGDLGMVVEGDVVIMLSNSGETPEMLRLLERIKRLGVSMIACTGNASSTLARNSDVALDVGVDKEACPLNLAPTASTTAALALGDALAVAVFDRKGFRPEDFAHLHPGGVLGKKLMRVSELMRTGDRIPRVAPDTAMSEVIYEMSRKGLGITSVVARDGRLLGVISDGDLRRLLEKRKDVLQLKAAECMTCNPVTISASDLAVQALHTMETRKITSLMVTDSEKVLGGIIHLHDLWRTELV